MKTLWLRKEGSGELILFFNGWGMDHHIAAHLLADSLAAGFTHDLLVCYDYRLLEPEEGFMDSISRYGKVTLIAWSFGVWAASQIELPSLNGAIAINGTLQPVSEDKGITPEVFQATLSTYSEENRNRFNRRMCGSRQALALFESMVPDRTALDQQEELARLQELLQSRSLTSSVSWHFTHALIGGRDLVFPAQQQYNAWHGVPQTIIAEMAHFPFFHFRTFQELLACIRV